MEETMRYYIAVFAIVLCLGMSIEGGKDESKFARLAVQAFNSTRQASVLDNLDSLFGTFQDFLKKLESRFASVESKLSTAVSTLQSKLSSQQNSLSSQQSRLATALNDVRLMKSKLADLGSRYCLTGEIGCDRHQTDKCKDVNEKPGQGHKDVTRYIRFSRAFTKPPVVMLIHKELSIRESGDADWFGWLLQTSELSESGFRATIELWDTTIHKFWVQWVACSTIQYSSTDRE